MSHVSTLVQKRKSKLYFSFRISIYQKTKWHFRYTDSSGLLNVEVKQFDGFDDESKEILCLQLITGGKKILSAAILARNVETM